MKSTVEHPFAFFDTYFEKEIHNDLKEFYQNITEELYFNHVDNIDRVKHTIKVLNLYHQDEIKSDYITFSFEGAIKSKLTSEIKHSKNFIEQGFEKRFSDKKEVKAYANFLRIKLNFLSENKVFNEFSFLTTYFEEFYILINRYSKETKSYQFIPSFKLLADNPKEKINTLFGLLTEIPSMINCTEEEFEKAFTGQEVEQGIHWLVIGKSKQISKVSLFYLVEKLIEHEFISSSILVDLSKYVKYVFRDSKGDELKNLKQSKATYSKNVTAKARIDGIISSL